MPMQEMQERHVQSLDPEDTLKKKIATHFSTENPGGLQSLRSTRVGLDLVTKQQSSHFTTEFQTPVISTYLFFLLISVSYITNK